jgi:hypothetical protein
MSGEENIEIVQEPNELQDEIAYLKSRRAVAKAAVTRIITAVDQLMAIDSNLVAVKERMIEFDQLMQDFATAHDAYADRLIDDNERQDEEEYWKNANKPANELNDVVGAWIAELEDQDKDNDEIEENNEMIDEVEDDKVKESQHKQLDVEQTVQHNAALEAKVQAVKRQQALELEAFELKTQELEEQMNLERQRIKLQLELEKRRKIMEEEMMHMKAELAQLKMNTETKEDTPTDMATKVAKVDLRFTHSTPNVSTPKRDLQPPPPESNQSFERAHYTSQSKPGDAEKRQPPWTPSALYRGDSMPQHAPHTTFADVLQQMMNDTRMHQQSLVDSLQRPKIELMTFDGDPLKYWPFIRAFTNAVDSKSDDDGSKLNSLMQYCSGKARSLLQCCLVKEPTEGYRLAWELLKERFGNNDVISQAWIAKILDRPKIKNTQGLQTFADELRTCRETLLTMGYLNELETRRSLCQIVEKLPLNGDLFK